MIAGPPFATVDLPHTHSSTGWREICALDDIPRNAGVCALIDDQQIAVFRVGPRDDLFALSNFDPFSRAFVLSRGILGDRDGVPKVASPVYKNNFNLRTGRCLDDDSVAVPVYPVAVRAARVWVEVCPTTPGVTRTP